MAAEWLITVAPAVGAVVAFTAAFFVFRTAAGRTQNRRLALIFVLEGSALSLGAMQWLNDDHDNALRAARTIQMTYFILPLAYLDFLATLPSRLVSPLRPRLVRSVLLGLAIFWLALYLTRPAWFVYDIQRGPSGDWQWVTGSQPPFLGILYPMQILVPIFGFVVALASYLGATRGTAARARGGFYAAAFGTRDTLLVAVLGGGIFFGDASPVSRYLYSVGLPLGTILPVILLTYGVLRTQLFDIDLKIKRGISRGTTVAIFVIAVFIAFQIASQYLNRSYGFIASGVTTGLLLFLSPRLNKFADGVSNAALPKVQPTSEYLTFKKLEVYRAAVESALETGGVIDTSERAMLDKMRGKLGIGGGDAAALEAELVAATASPISPASL